MAAIGKDIQLVRQLLTNGKVVAIPTETVYGLAANALDTSAVEQIFTVKNRPHYNPLILHIGSSPEVEKYVTAIPAVAQLLMDKFWPGPLTLLLPKKAIVPDIITASLPNVAIRVPNHPLTLELLRMIDFPLAAPSANPFCYISPTQTEHVQQQIGHKIPYILDGGPCSQGVESTIVGFENDMPVIYRLGAIAPEEIEKVAGRVTIYQKTHAAPVSPGMLPFHYSPRTPFYFTNKVEELLQDADPATTGIITFHRTIENFPQAHLAILSASASMQEAASNLYASLHRLDALQLKIIIAEKLPDYGLGKTINERLYRAAGKTMPQLV